MTEERKERRARQANAIRVKASLPRMPMEEFDCRYKQPYFVANHTSLAATEFLTQEMFCEECMQPAHGGLAAHVLYVTIENDPLRNFWKLATLHCYGCGFEEIVPLSEPKFTPSDFNELGLTPSPAAIQDVWRDAYAKQHGEYSATHQRIQQQQQAAHRQVQESNFQRQMLQQLQDHTAHMNLSDKLTTPIKR
jgi:hypothetical protein